RLVAVGRADEYLAVAKHDPNASAGTRSRRWELGRVLLWAWLAGEVVHEEQSLDFCQLDLDGLGARWGVRRGEVKAVLGRNEVGRGPLQHSPVLESNDYFVNCHRAPPEGSREEPGETHRPRPDSHHSSTIRSTTCRSQIPHTHTFMCRKRCKRTP